MRLAGKVAIITGAGSGIGRATARRFAAEGAKLVIGDKSEGVHETADVIGGDGVVAMQMDAGSEADVERLVATAVDRFGGLDVAYANAGISGGLTGIFDHTVEEWQTILQVNLIGPFLMIKHAAPKMVERGKGSIICTASVAGIRSGAGCPAYSASKAGVINLVMTTAQQLSATNVRVNAICPGLIQTGMTQRAFDYAAEKGVTDKIGRLNPLRRAGQPEEIANMALFLASDEASYVNGQAIAVDGGLSSSHPVTRQETGKTAA
ncbi:glucose 1-dehydrogenase [Sphingomonas sp. MAH-20]|uniref:Glucose 1-dehydrogenase n=1 Tax=Sphingomonas horti TaxID=2682842 RepID=A0A6I4J5H5_9SPHN|nr:MULTISPECIES: SDR family oxidoreductase [Sphingomonas]MBA2921126.1 SDR family oxidoreductase [Sphingomonas sp. CGMCC 1.13658]MVO79368.1 glucose 1-dehydrogenase [Sphingomonas horti]